MKTAERWPIFDCLWIVLCGILSSVFIVSASSKLGATFDEPLYLQLGLAHWRTGSTHGLMRVGTMPLPVDVATLPVYLWERLRGQPFDPMKDIDCILPVARGGSLVFWWLLLVLGWRCARNLGGPWAGRAAVALLSCEPNLLAHAGLATTDIALTACLLLFCWLFNRSRNGGWGVRVGLPAVGYAIAMLAKASALAFVPICALILEAYRQSAATDLVRMWPRLRQVFFAVFARRNLWDAAQTFALAMGLVYVYCGSDWRAEPSFVAWAETLPDGATGDFLRWCSQNLCIFNNAGVAFARQIKHNMQGHGVYILGETAPRSLWYYFPVALAVKEPLPLLLAPIAVLLFKPRALLNRWMLITVGLLLFSLNCRVQIGIRLVLPITVFLILGLAVAYSQATITLDSEWRRRLLRVFAIVSIGWMALSTVLAWPNGLGYINEAWGGPQNAHRLLSDSNCDWGQGLPELSEWSKRDGGEICVWYFGTDPRINQPPFDHIPVHREPVFDADDLRARTQGRKFAVSKTLLYGGYKSDPRQRELLDWLRSQHCSDQTSTFLIFDLSDQKLVNK